MLVEVHSVVSDVTLKMIFFPVGQKLGMCAGRGTQRGKGWKLCGSWSEKKVCSVGLLPWVRAAPPGKVVLGAACAQLCCWGGLQEGAAQPCAAISATIVGWVTMAPCECSLGCQPLLGKISQDVSKPSSHSHCYWSCCLSLFGVLFFVLKRSYLNLFWLAAAPLEKASRPDSLSDMFSVLMLLGFSNFFSHSSICVKQVESMIWPVAWKSLMHQPTSRRFSGNLESYMFENRKKYPLPTVSFWALHFVHVGQ